MTEHKVFQKCKNYKKGVCTFFYNVDLLYQKKYSLCKEIPKENSLSCLGMDTPRVGEIIYNENEIYQDFEYRHTRVNNTKDVCLDCQATYNENTLTWS